MVASFEPCQSCHNSWLHCTINVSSLEEKFLFIKRFFFQNVLCDTKIFAGIVFRLDIRDQSLFVVRAGLNRNQLGGELTFGQCYMLVNMGLINKG